MQKKEPVGTRAVLELDKLSIRPLDTKNNPTTTYECLSIAIKSLPSEPSIWLDVATHLNPNSRRAARQSRDTYRAHHGLTRIDLLRSHGYLEGAFFEGAYNLDTLSITAAFFADITEKKLLATCYTDSNCHKESTRAVFSSRVRGNHGLDVITVEF